MTAGRGELLARIDTLTAALAAGDELTRIRDRRELDATRAALTVADTPPPGGRHPYVGHGADGARRSAQIDREEADSLDRADPRYPLLLESAADWDRQADAWEAR